MSLQRVQDQVIKWEKVHVFISSTFNDMHAERDYLVKRVFPSLRDWCERRKLRLVDIDLRWGVTEADASNKNAVKICLEYIDRCRPFFVCFLGQRHGHAPGAEGISSETFDEFPDLINELHPAASITELEIRHAIFRPLASRDPENRGRLIHYDLADHAFFYFREPSFLEELKETLFTETRREGDGVRATGDPEELEGAARQLFWTYTDEIGPESETPDERERRRLSLEALEKLKRDIKEHSLTQSPAQRPVEYGAGWRTDLTTPELALPLECPFLDEAGRQHWRKAWDRWARLGLAGADLLIPEPKRAAAQRHNETLTRGRPSKFRSLTGTIRGRGGTGGQFPAGTELARIIQHDLQQAILARYPERREIPETTELQREIDQHEEFISNSIEGFIKRGGDFAELDAYVESDSNKLFVLTAAGGVGKSTLLAYWIHHHQSRIEHRSGSTIHFRFVGQSDESNTAYSLLRSLLREIKEVAGKLDEEVPLDPRNLRQQLPGQLAAIGRRGPTVIVIDALDQLESGLADFNWIPQRLPDNVKLIVSFKRDDEVSEDVYRRLKEGGQVTLSEVEPFKRRSHRRRLVKAYLSQYLKQLDKQHREALIRSDGAGNPLYLKVALSELRVFGAFASLREKISREFGDNPISAFGGVLRRLESDPAYSPLDPREAVPLLFGLLAHARRGLSIGELTSLFIQTLGIADNQEQREAVADTIYLFLRQVRPFMARREGRYDFFFASFRLAAQERYVAKSPGDQIPKRPSEEWHKILADYFHGLPTWQEAAARGEAAESAGSKQPTRRKVAELPFHLTQAADWGRLGEVLCDLGFIEAKCAAGLTFELVGDYDTAVRRWPRQALPLPLSTQAAVFPSHAPSTVRAFGHFIFQHAGTLARDPTQVVAFARNYADSGPVVEAADAVLSARSWEDRPWIELVDRLPFIEHPALIHKLEGHESEVTSVAISADGRRAVSGSTDGTARVWNLALGSCERTILAHEQGLNGVALTPDGAVAATAGADGLVKVWRVDTGDCLVAMPADSREALSVALNPKATVAYVGGMDGTVGVWDIGRGERVRELRGHFGPVSAIALSADGHTLVSGSWDCMARVWSVETWRCAACLPGHEVPVQGVAVDRTAFRIATCAGLPPDADGRVSRRQLEQSDIRIWESGSQVGRLQPHTIGHRGGRSMGVLGSVIYGIALSLDGRVGVSVGYDRVVAVHSLGRWPRSRALVGHTGSVSCVAVDAAGGVALTGSADRTVRVWDLEGETPPERSSFRIGRTGRGAHAPPATHARLLWQNNRIRLLILLPLLSLAIGYLLLPAITAFLKLEGTARTASLASPAWIYGTLLFIEWRAVLKQDTHAWHRPLLPSAVWALLGLLLFPLCWLFPVLNCPRCGAQLCGRRRLFHCRSCGFRDRVRAGKPEGAE